MSPAPKSKGLGQALGQTYLTGPVEQGLQRAGVRPVGAKGSKPQSHGTRVPSKTLGGALAVGTALTLGEVGTGFALAGLVVSPAAWALVHRASFRRVAFAGVRDYAQRRFVYQRKWDEALTLCGLQKRYGSQGRVPRLLSVWGSDYYDHVTVRLLPGQRRDHVMIAARDLAASFGSDACRVHKVDRRRWQRHTRVRLDFQRRDALRDTVLPLPILDDVDFEAVPVGRTEYGETWCVRVLGTHILIGGETGSGKASVLWSIVRGLAPAVRDGRVQLWGIDPKDGMELTHYRRGFKEYLGEQADIEQQIAMLQRLVRIMEARSAKYAGLKRRRHEVTLEDPLIVCIIDELADITLHEDVASRKLAIGCMAKICRRARAVGITLVMAMQSPPKDAVPFRDLIPDGIGLRLKARYQVEAVCGEGSFDAGAHCLEIDGPPEPGQPLDGRGRAFKTSQGEKQPMAVRASYHTDADLAWLEENYPAASVVAREREREALREEFDIGNDERERSTA